LQNLPLESSCVVVAVLENYNTSKPLKFSLEKSQILSCDTVVANERYVQLFSSLNTDVRTTAWKATGVYSLPVHDSFEVLK